MIRLRHAVALALALGLAQQVARLAAQETALPPSDGQRCVAAGKIGGAQRLCFAYGTEDFAYDRRGERLIVSAQDRRPVPKGGRRPPGSIWVVPLAGGAAGTPYRLAIEGGLPEPEPFHPLGIALFDDGRSRRLFVVNRSDPESGEPFVRTVEVFDLVARTLVRRQPIASSALRNPNGVAAVGADEIYVTNDGRSDGLADGLAKLLRLGTGNVLHCRGGSCRPVADRIAFANGVAVSAGGDRLFVASFGDRALRVYRRAEDGTLAPKYATIRLPAQPDNLEWEDHAAGVLDVACHVDRLATYRHLRDVAEPAPSQGLRVYLNQTPPTHQLLFYDSGRLAPASATALVVGRKLYVSFLADDGLAVYPAPVCDGCLSP